MDTNHASLSLAGLIGGATAIIHGVLTQRLMAAPVGRLMEHEPRISLSIRRLIPLLLQYSTYSWLVGGLALVAVANWWPQARLPVSLLVGSSYLYAAVANCWGTRGRHPGWMLMAAALFLIIADFVAG